MRVRTPRWTLLFAGICAAVAGLSAANQGQTLFTNQTPARTRVSDGANVNYELGMRFTSSAAGQITAIRFWKSSRESGMHTGRIWSGSGTQLAQVTFTGETHSGWQQQALTAPLSIAANTEYMVTVNTGNTYYVATNNGLRDPITNGYLSSIAGGNGRFGPVGQYPTQSWLSTNYFRDVVFVAGSAPPPADSIPPSVPSGLSATAASTSRINLSWTASTDNVTVAGYRIYRGGVQIGTAAGISYSDTGLSPATTYTYTVAAYDAAGNVSAQSTPASATTQSAADTTPPSVPSGLSATAVSASQINLSWAASTDNVAVTGYRVFRGGVQIGASAGTSYSNTGLNPATAYTYTVAAYDAAGNVSAQSTPASATTQSAADTTPPSVPTGLSATAVSASQINLSWAASTDNVAVTGYRVFRGGVQIGTSAGTSYSNTGLNPATAYTYTVAAYDAAGNVSAQSTPASATTQPGADTTPPSVPSGLSATAVSASQINLSWAASTDNVAVTGYRVFRGGVQIGTSSGTSYSNTGLSPATAYTYTVAAYDAAGNVSGQSTSASATTQSGGGDTTPPSISGVAHSNVTSSGVAIAWTTDEPATTQVEYGPTTAYESMTALNSSLVTAHSQALTGLTANTSYHYRVLSRDQAQNLSVSADYTFVTPANQAPTLRYHRIVTDADNKLLAWYSADPSAAYDHYLRTLWTWLPTVPNGPNSTLPMYYLYCGFRPGNPIQPDTWENDWGERLPNFVEFARLFYAYSGDMGPLNIARGMADYALAHGMTPSTHSWPNLAFGAANAGATEINGDNVAWSRDDVLLDLASDMGMSFYRLYQVFGDERYRTAAVNTANTLASKMQPGSQEYSPLPYVVNANTGAMRSRYTSNWAGLLTLFDLLIENNEPNAAACSAARQTLKNWILQYPMQNGKWVDGHSDIYIDGSSNFSNTTKSNMNLYLLDNPGWDPNFATDVPRLLKWTEDNMVNVQSSDGLPGVYYGAWVPIEQFGYNYRMGYQTARQAGEYAAWYEVTGDPVYKDRAFRGFNYSTYMMKDSGESSDGPTDNVGYWWGDTYAEGPRMFFFGFRGAPEWAPAGQNHILYSRATLRNVAYTATGVQYDPANASGTEYLRTAFLPATVTVGGVSIAQRSDLNGEGFVVTSLGSGDYSVKIRRARPGAVAVSAGM